MRVPAAALTLLGLWASIAPAQSIAHCDAAANFLRVDRKMVAQVDTQTVDDWRTRQMLQGCRVTAAGRTALGTAREAALFYERIRATGWIRTPDPRDAAHEASLRFRKGNSDCLFNVYAGATLFTEAETAVSEAMIPAIGETRYNVFVMCVPAMRAAPR